MPANISPEAMACLEESARWIAAETVNHVVLEPAKWPNYAAAILTALRSQAAEIARLTGGYAVAVDEIAALNADRDFAVHQRDALAEKVRELESLLSENGAAISDKIDGVGGDPAVPDCFAQHGWTPYIARDAELGRAVRQLASDRATFTVHDVVDAAAINALRRAYRAAQEKTE